ncbi:E3 ubiquitin-protein ligase ORTHRUS 2 [Datura stramonium]|uniref:E3 ubiquitin-protein ligase ORTHRUS 2 n=1 Tax=Datura stramonium TaxID=4076 RepID=A0ABS8SG94_DATST|nr:E3 ubiquitin-protein ligase ORTHRUS 2 [Datura stramonium]
MEHLSEEEYCSVDFSLWCIYNNCNVRRKEQRERRNPDSMYLNIIQTSCGHNFCLKCFKKWIGQGKDTCVKCRSQISRQMINQPRINSALVTAIRMAKESRKNDTPRRPQAAYPQMNQEDRPDSPFIREGAAKRAGMANASSGRIFVTVPSDHFGPILAENDPERNQGVLVGESWTHRLNCRQWGVHWPHVAGIAGRAKYGAQSVVLSGGYEDDEDHGEWLLYTGSGGRDLSGNKRTNKDQSFDQSFTNSNEALRVSCKQGYPVRVVRSHKEKRSSYAPQDGLRYDGVYRIEKCWRKMGKQGYKLCRYLFVRCDNEPAPWTSDERGDKPRPLPEISELEDALDIFERTHTPSWDYNGEEDRWKWKKPPPPSQQRVVEVSSKDGKRTKNKTPRKSQKTSVKDTLLKGFGCVLCKNVLTLPVTTPCAHNFCKACLEEAFKGQSFIKERECHNGRKLRSQKNFMKCPACPLDISELLQNPQVNRELEDAIGKLREEFYKSDNHKEDANEEAIKEETSSENRMSNDESLSNDKKLRRAYKKKKTDAGDNSTNNDGLQFSILYPLMEMS